MRRNPRHNGSERAGSRPHETNFLTWFNEYMECVFFLFPGRVRFLFFYGHWDPQQTKNLPGKVFVYLKPSDVIPNLGLECQHFF